MVFVVEKVTRVEDFHGVLLFILSFLFIVIFFYTFAFTRKKNGRNLGTLKMLLRLPRSIGKKKTGTFYPPKKQFCSYLNKKFCQSSYKLLFLLIFLLLNFPLFRLSYLLFHVQSLKHMHFFKPLSNSFSVLELMLNI